MPVVVEELELPFPESIDGGALVAEQLRGAWTIKSEHAEIPPDFLARYNYDEHQPRSRADSAHPYHRHPDLAA